MKKAMVMVLLGILIITMASLKSEQEFLYHSKTTTLKPYKSAGPPSCYAGEAPGYNNCTNSGCHDDGVVNTGSAQVTLNMGLASDGYYKPGEVYTITISVSKKGMVRSGFQFIALKDSDNATSPGTFTLLNTARTQMLDALINPHPGECDQANKVWVEHKFEGITSTSDGYNSWSFKWQAPSKNVGKITFYLAVLEANNDLDPTGDHAYTIKRTIAASSASVSQMNDIAGLRVYPNPAAAIVNIDLAGKDKSLPDEIALFDLLGKCIGKWERQELQLTSEGIITLPVNDKVPGMYYLTMKGNGYSATRKVSISR